LFCAAWTSLEHSVGKDPELLFPPQTQNVFTQYVVEGQFGLLQQTNAICIHGTSLNGKPCPNPDLSNTESRQLRDPDFTAT
jgi:hypothetical protein